MAHRPLFMFAVVLLPALACTTEGVVYESKDAGARVRDGGNTSLDGGSLTSTPLNPGDPDRLPADGGISRVEEDASAGPVDGGVDAAPPVVPCSEDRLLVGAGTHFDFTDDVPSAEVNAFPYAVSAAGIARCVRVEIAVPSASPVLIGVYADDDGVPGVLATTATIANPVVGWNSAPLATGLGLSQGARVWLALVPREGELRLGVKQSCAERRIHPGAGGSIPSSFRPNSSKNYCDAAFYLSP